MKVPFSWLKDYVDIDVSAKELADKLFSCGFEVEELSYLGEKIENVVCGEVKSLTPHPDSDHMQICIVDCGEKYGKDLQIVTGAPNVYVGMRTPVALDNSTVCETNPAMLEKNPDGVKKIKKGKLRGVESCGMLCSGEELGINEDFYKGADVYGLLDLGKDAPIGEDVRKIVGLDDYIFDIALTANRPDCQSVLGIAREVAAVLKKPLKMPATDYTEHSGKERPITVDVLAPDLCPRYIGHFVEEVKGGETLAWMRKRLALCGLRSISPVVDITNFVLLEIGQPMHAFDADEIGDRKIVVRRALDKEKITTLDDKEFTLTKDNLVICDGKKPVALAGIMGGKNSEIKDTTKNVFFEAAKFARDSVRKTSRSLGQSSDSSFRFEKGVDAYTPELGMARALHLIEELHAGIVSDQKVDVCSADLTKRTITADIQKIDALLGIEIPRAEMQSILESLSFSPKIEGDKLTVEIPLYRDDMDGVPDIAEELIRMYGYDHITPTFLEKAQLTNGGETEAQKREKLLKNVLVDEGFLEACNYSFYSPKDLDLIRLPVDAKERNGVRVLNPISEDLSLMRTLLIPSMLQNAVRNLRRGNDKGKEFEIANVFVPKETPIVGQPEERRRLVIGVWGDGADFFEVKGGVEAVLSVCHEKAEYVRADKPYLHPGVSANVLLDGKEIGCLGELDPAIALSLGLDKKVVLAEIDLDAVYEKADCTVHFKNLSKFPSVSRDLALIVDEKITCAEVEEVLYHSVKYVSNVRLFDVYRGGQVEKGKKSMAFTLTFTPEQNAESGFTSENIDAFVKKILGNLKFKIGAELR